MILIACIVLAVSVGPSSAIAMIPRVGYWPAGATRIWLNGTEDQVFPTVVSADGIPSSCANSSIVPGSITCPSSGWQNIAGLAPFERFTLGPATSNWPNDDVLRRFDAGLPSTIQLPGKAALRTLYLCTIADQQCFNTLATTQHAAIADASETVGLFWVDGVNSIDGSHLTSNANAVHTVESSQLFVTVDCTSGGIINGPEDTGPIFIDTRLPNAIMGENWGQQINLSTVKPSEVFNMPGDPKNPAWSLLTCLPLHQTKQR